MKFIFETPTDYDELWSCVHDSIIYWKKVRQECQGKICLQVDGSETHYDEEYVIKEMIDSALMLKAIEDSPHPVWNEETKSYELKTEDYNSGIITKTLKMIPQIPVNEDPDCNFGSEYESGINYEDS